jgi:hypothetical protein
MLAAPEMRLPYLLTAQKSILFGSARAKFILPPVRNVGFALVFYSFQGYEQTYYSIMLAM